MNFLFVIYIKSKRRSKITRLAISQAKIPYGIMEVDNERKFIFYATLINFYFYFYFYY